MKRFTETEKWRDPWFRTLPAPSKLAFFYILDHCNNAGFHELDKGLMVILTGMKSEHVEGALKGLTRSIIGPCDGWYWVRRFLRHQKNEDLNPSNPAHKQIIALTRDQLERFKGSSEFSDFVGHYKGLLSPIGTGLVKVQDKKRRELFEKPTREEAKVYGSELKMSPEDIESWYDHYESNGWRVGGKAKMTDWKAGMRNGSRMKGRNGTNQRHTTESSRNIGTANEGKSSQYKGVGKIPSVSDPSRPTA